MAVTVTHAKTDSIADWTQAELDAQIALGNYPPGTVLANIVLPSDWNAGHTVSGLGTLATQNGTFSGTSSGTNTGDQTSVSGNAGTATALQNARTIGGVSFDGTANIVPQTIQSVNEATDTTCFLLFISASGAQSLQPLNNTSLTFNASTGAFGATILNVTGLANSVQATFKQHSTQTANLIEYKNSAGTVFGSVGGLDSSSKVTNGLFAFRDKGLVADGGGSPEYDYGATVTIHTDDDAPYLVKMYNEAYSTTIPIFSYFGWADGRFVESTFGGPIEWGTNGYSAPNMHLHTDGNLGIGTVTPSARLHAFKTTEQLRLGYSDTVYYSSTVASTGAVTLDAVGASPSFTFSDRIINTLPLRLKGYTVATLPAGTQGDSAYVTDALAPTFLTALTGGGTVVTPVFYNGTAWVSY